MDLANNETESEQAETSEAEQFDRILKTRGWIGSKAIQLLPSFSFLYFQLPKWKRRQLEEEGEYPVWKINRFFIRLHCPFVMGLDGIECPRKVYLIFLILIYLAMKCLVCLWLYLQLDNQLRLWHPDLRFLLNRTASCYIPDQLNQQDSAVLHRMAKIRGQLYQFGLPITPPNDALIIALLMLLTSVVMALLAPPLVANVSFHFNHATFRFLPMIERKRLDYELSRLINLNYDEDNQELEHDVKPSTKIVIHQPEEIEFESIQSFRKEAEFEYLRVRPAHTTVDNYKSVISAELKSIAVFNVIVWTIGTLSQNVLYYREINYRVEQRLEEVQCHEWHPLGKPINYPLELDELIVNREMYYSRGANWTKMELAIWVELPNMMMKPKNLLLATEILLLYDYFAVLAGIYFVILIVNKYLQSIWFGQVKTEVKRIKGLLDEHWVLGSLASCKSDLRQLENLGKQIERSLWSCYFNYFLFRKELVQQRPVFQFIILQACILVLGLASFWFIRLSSIDSRSQYVIWIVVIISVLCLNFMGFLSLSLTINLQKLFRDLNGLIAKSNQNSIQDSKILRLWRRQIMSSTDVEATYGISVLGFEFSQSNLLHFNSYILGASIYIYRTYH